MPFLKETKLRKAKNAFRLVIPLILISVSALACNLPVGQMDEEGSSSQETFIAQTVDAGDDEEGEVPATITPDDEPSPTEPSPPPAATETEVPPEVHVEGDTNCRTGPGDVYEIRGAVLAGENVPVKAEDPSGSYWYVDNPDQPGSQCWIWGEYATPEGSMANLPVYTPRPTPTPQVVFQPTYLQTTGFSSLFMEFEIKNTGRTALESISVKVIDKDTSDTVPTRTRDDFGKILGEGEQSGSIDTLQSGKKGFAYSDFFPFGGTGAAGHQMQAIFKACTQDGLTGRCTTKTINFKSK